MNLSKETKFIFEYQDGFKEERVLPHGLYPRGVRRMDHGGRPWGVVVLGQVTDEILYKNIDCTLHPRASRDNVRVITDPEDIKVYELEQLLGV